MYLALPEEGRKAVRDSVYRLAPVDDGFHALKREWSRRARAFNANPFGYVEALQNADRFDVARAVTDLLEHHGNDGSATG